jgi:hypothetical protein
MGRYYLDIYFINSFLIASITHQSKFIKTIKIVIFTQLFCITLFLLYAMISLFPGSLTLKLSSGGSAIFLTDNSQVSSTTNYTTYGFLYYTLISGSGGIQSSNVASNAIENNPDPLSPPFSPGITQRGDRSQFFNLNRDLTEEYEQRVIQELRNLRQERAIAIRFLILLIIVPLSIQVITKNLIYSPLIDHFMVENKTFDQIKISEEIVEEQIQEFTRFKELLEIREILEMGQPLNDSEKRKKLKEKAQELTKEAMEKNLNGLKNLVADLTSLASFALLVAIFKKEFKIVRQFLSRSFLGLSDITKVFIFILLTDIFVGFHSAEGWEVILGSTFGHFGLPENRQFIYIFIATFPVILDSFFKLLIFNYFTRKSPAAVAILEKMQQ